MLLDGQFFVSSTMKEIWDYVPGYENKYLISTFGRVYSIKFKRLVIPSIRKGDGGLVVGLRGGKPRKVFGVHQLVAAAFISNPLNRTEIDHKDNDRANNHIDNLQWCTRSENIKWAYDRGRDRKFGEKHKQAKFTNQQANIIRDIFKNGAKATAIAMQYSCSVSTIRSIVNYQSYK